MKYILILIIGALIAISCERDLTCETVLIETRDYHDNGQYEDRLGRYDNVTHEFEDCF